MLEGTFISSQAERSTLEAAKSPIRSDTPVTNLNFQVPFSDRILEEVDWSFRKAASLLS